MKQRKNKLRDYIKNFDTIDNLIHCEIARNYIKHGGNFDDVCRRLIEFNFYNKYTDIGHGYNPKTREKALKDYFEKYRDNQHKIATEVPYFMKSLVDNLYHKIENENY